jgi:hypothetical protein
VVRGLISRTRIERQLRGRRVLPRSAGSKVHRQNHNGDRP